MKITSTFSYMDRDEEIWAYEIQDGDHTEHGLYNLTRGGVIGIDGYEKEVEKHFITKF